MDDILTFPYADISNDQVLDFRRMIEKGSFAYRSRHRKYCWTNQLRAAGVADLLIRVLDRDYFATDSYQYFVHKHKQR